MTHLTKWIGKLLFVLMAIALITYAASRTLDFVNSTLGQDDQVIGYLALFATTGGALAWLAVFLWDSEGIAQKGIALVMIIIDVLGEITLFTIDTLLQSGANGLTATLAPEEIRLTVLGMSGLIGVNIIATFAFHIANPENIERIEAHFADWQIDQAIRKAKTAAAQSIAGEIAEQEAAAYKIAQRAKDRSDKAQDERTAREVFGGIFGKTKRDDLPIAAAETVGLPTLTNQPLPTEAQKQAAREFAQLHMYVPGDGKNPQDASQPAEETADGANFQDIPESQNGGLDGGYIPTQEAV